MDSDGPKATKQTRSTDWTKCILCQDVKPEEDVQIPSKGPTSVPSVSYKTFADSLAEFAKLGALPFDIAILDGGSGVEDTTTKQNAIWYNSCRQKYSKTELARAHKRTCEPTKTEEVMPAKFALQCTNTDTSAQSKSN